MKGLNKVMLIGRLGKDPELRYTQGGQAVAKFSLATDDFWTDRNGEKQNRTEWHNIVIWGKMAESCANILKKGRLAYVEGRIQTRQYEGQDGGKRYITEIVANDWSVLEARGAAGNVAEPGGGYHVEYNEPPVPRDSSSTQDAPITEDDVPF